MDPVGIGETLVTRTARALSRLSMECEDGDFLGAEDELLARLGVSRPTLRQAAKIAENDRLISIRRGIKGGFYAARPDAADAIRTLTRYLRLKGGTLQHILALNRLVSEEAAGLAARCDDPGLRARLDGFAGRIDGNDSPNALIYAEGELANLVAAMSGNPAIELVMAIGFSFGMEEHKTGLFRDPAQREQTRKMQYELCRAILAGDAEVAGLLMRRRSAAISAWLDRAATEP